MTLNELMMGNIQSSQGTAVLQLGSQAAQKSGSKSKDTTFGDLLGDRMSNAADRRSDVKRNESNVSARRKNTEQVSDKADNKPRYLSFKEANERNVKASASESAAGSVTKRSKVDDSRPDEVDDDSESAAGSKTKRSKGDDSRPDEVDDDSESAAAKENQPNSMLHIFAQLLGLDIKDLQKLLKEACINPESFGSIQNLAENASKLSQTLGLSSEQQGTLVQILQLAGETLDSLTAVQAGAAGEALLPSDTKSTVSVETEGTQLSVTDGNLEALQAATALESLASKLGLKIKVKLNDLSTKLSADQKSVEAELLRLMQHSAGKAAMDKQQPVQQAVEADIGDTAVQTVNALNTDTETAASQDESGQETNAKAENETLIRQPITVLNETKPQGAFAALQPGNVYGTDVIKAAIAEAPVAAKEIISQVIEQAKVILTPEKSEMSMDLKPDGLGKISLKVVTENGIIMAKFIADSQQVRQVLETNMQLLKDSLEKQGMVVQGFSVSVRQDSNQSGRNWTKPQNGTDRSITGTAYRTAGIESSLADVLEAAGMKNPYLWGSSTINLTA